MPNSLKTKLSKLRYKGKITNEEYQGIIKKLDGHDARARAAERNKTIEEMAIRLLNEMDNMNIQRTVMNVVRQMKGDEIAPYWEEMWSDFSSRL